MKFWNTGGLLIRPYSITRSSWSNKGSLPLVLLMYPNEVIGASELQLGVNGGTPKLLQSSWDEGKRILELCGDLVECPVVNVKLQALIIFATK